MEANTDTPSSATTSSSSKDPAAVWWRDAAGAGAQRPLAPIVEPVHVEEPWRWRWSPLIGITYGPIPVGLIISLPILLTLWAR